MANTARNGHRYGPEQPPQTPNNGQHYDSQQPPIQARTATSNSKCRSIRLIAATDTGENSHAVRQVTDNTARYVHTSRKVACQTNSQNWKLTVGCLFVLLRYMYKYISKVHLLLRMPLQAHLQCLKIHLRRLPRVPLQEQVPMTEGPSAQASKSASTSTGPRCQRKW